MTRTLLHAALSILAGALLGLIAVWALLGTLSLDIPVL